MRIRMSPRRIQKNKSCLSSLCGTVNGITTWICVALLIALNLVAISAIHGWLPQRVETGSGDDYPSVHKSPSSVTLNAAPTRKIFKPACRQIFASDRFRINECLRNGKHSIMVSREDRSTCLESLKLRVSMDKELDTKYKQEMGPDSFYMILDGPERVAPLAKYTTHCMYSFDLNVGETGMYLLTLYHYATDFAALNEVGNKIDFASNTKEILKSHSIQLTAPQVEKSEDDRICGRKGDTIGSYFRVSSDRPASKEVIYKFDNYKIPYVWTPSCKYDQTFEIHQNDHCFANNHRVVFVGDSQIRETYNLLQKRLSGDLTPTQQTVKFPPTRYVFGDKQGPHLEVSWIKDEYLKHLLHNLTVLDSYDKLVFEVGHWPFTIAREGGHWKMGQYKALLKAIFSALSSYNAERIARGLKSLQAVFTGVYSVGICSADNNDAKCSGINSKAGWRSPDRLRVANDAARELTSAVGGIDFVDGFGRTSPWILEAPDGFHFIRTPGLDAMVDEILHKLDLCDRGGV